MVESNGCASRVVVVVAQRRSRLWPCTSGYESELIVTHNMEEAINIGNDIIPP